ncbi:ABC transporter substrate-binding protein [Pseudonocardiaceae bacterium YIM PH 21723]|nr:ABC transporter substrate-binding protein [Pseudonocardiaceae bacterium YIM PH 21723]
MGKIRKVAVVAAALSAALVMAGCGSGTDAGNAESKISIWGGEPQNPLVPGNTTEAYGSKVVRSMFTGLTQYDPATYKSKDAMAEKIDIKEGSKVFDITIKKGWKFHDGTEVKAKNFVDAWNYTAFGPNGQGGASFLQAVDGYDATNAKDSTVKELKGLKVVSDYEFTVTMAKPFAIFPQFLGYVTFSPLPDSFFKDPKAFEAKPIGNGPFKFVSRVPNANIELTRYDEYQGADKPHFKDLDVKVYSSQEAAYTDLVAGNLDYMDTIPSTGLNGDKYKTDLPDRNGEINSPIIQTLQFPTYDERYKSPDLRKAISKAINRPQITEKIFNNARVPLYGWVGPSISGYTDNQCGDNCKYDPAAAKQLLEKSGFKGKIEISTNGDGGHGPWIEAVCNDIKNNLGLDCAFVPVPTFSEVLAKEKAKQMTALFRQGWIADYPSIENFLRQLYETGAGNNYSGYSNPAFDAKLKEADQKPNETEANKAYQEAEKMIANDMPSIPLWFQKTQSGWSPRLSNVRTALWAELDLSTVTVTG